MLLNKYYFYLGICEENKLFTLPKSRDVICFLARREGMKGYEEAHEACQEAGFDGNLELRYEEDANFTAKLVYCGSTELQEVQPGKYSSKIYRMDRIDRLNILSQ